MLRSHVMIGGESDHPHPPQEEGKLPLSLHLKLKRTHHLGEQEKEARGPLATADWRGCPRAGGWVACRLRGGEEMRELDTP